jgi:energy-coupling factor transport system ATP-binding protein
MRLVLDSVKKSYGSWSLDAEGEFLPGVHLITGRVGSGKTTLSLIAAGITAPDSGRITGEGIQTLTLSQQHPEYHITEPTLAREALSYGIDPATALRLAGLDGLEGKDPFALSRGELKRYHLTCLMLRTWDLLILDEPFSGLDCREKHRQCRMIEEKKKGIVLVFTHEQRVLPKCEYLWELREGRLTFLGRIPEAIRHWQSPPSHLLYLLEKGIVPDNLTEEDLLEAACRIRD